MKLLIIFNICLSGYVLGKENKACETSCGKGIEPVCGSDGVIYTNLCEMKKHNCGEKVYLVADEKCQRSTGSACEHKCSSQYDPVCGSDGRTYLNRCIFRVEQCRSGTSLAHYGPCIGATNNTDECPGACSNVPDDGPVCASDGNVYNSTCDLRIRTCGQKVVKTSYKHCQTTKHCQDTCFYDYKPICASDGRIYNSFCQMKVKNCGRHVFRVPMVYCRPQERVTGGCPITCQGEKLAPVCGSDGNLYDNECDMIRLNCGSSGALNIFKVSNSKCRDRFQKCAKIICPTTPDPVCGTDGNTYINYCLLHKASCQKGIQLAHYGRCPDMEQVENCTDKCIDPEEKYPICGSDGNVYKSFCDLKERTCGQKVVPVALHHCQGTKHCFNDCSKDKGAVCGSDGKMYKNKCEMKAKNCGKHVYEVPLSECLQGFKFFRCMRICPPVFDPVCGSDGKTYTNECFLSMEACRSRSLGKRRVSRMYHGTCGRPISLRKLYMFR